MSITENVIDDWNFEYTPTFHNYYFSSFETREEVDFSGASVNLKFCFAGEIINEFTGLVLNKCHEDETTQTDEACGDNKKTVTKTQYYNAYLVIKNFDFSVSVPGLILGLTNFINCKYFRSENNEGPIIDWNCPYEYTYDKFKFAYRLRIIIILKVVQTIYYVKDKISKVVVYPEVLYVVLQGCSGCIEQNYEDNYEVYMCDVFNSTFITDNPTNNRLPYRWLDLVIQPGPCFSIGYSIYTGPRQFVYDIYVDGLTSEINSKSSFYLIFNTFPDWLNWLLYLNWQWKLMQCLVWHDYYTFSWDTSDMVVGHKDCYLSPVSKSFENNRVGLYTKDPYFNISVTVEIYK
jgi:hypothetical protein